MEGFLSAAVDFVKDASGLLGPLFGLLGGLVLIWRDSLKAKRERHERMETALDNARKRVHELESEVARLKKHE